MGKRKSLSPSPELVRIFWVGCIFIVGIGLAVLAMAAAWRMLGTSPLFCVNDISIAEDIRSLDFSELQKLKGKNIFSIDLGRAEGRIQARYPQLADLRLTRRYPDEIAVTAIRREAFAVVSLDGRRCVVDRNGYMIAAPQGDEKDLPLIKGLKRQKVVPGGLVEDERVRLAFEIIGLFRKDARLAPVRFEAVDVGDLTRIVCELVDEEAGFLVVIDKDNVSARVRTLADVISRGGLDLKQVKYMDLRFGEPVIGQKKVKK